MPLAIRTVKMDISNILEVLIKTLIIVDGLIIHLAILFAVMWHDVFNRGVMAYCQVPHTIATKATLFLMQQSLHLPIAFE